MSENQSNNSGNNNRSRNFRPNGQAQGNNQGQNPNGGHHRRKKFHHRNRRPHHNNENRPQQRTEGQPTQQHHSDQKIYSGGDPRNLSTSKIVMHYDHLLEIHNRARAEYYEMFNRANPQQKEKLEKKFFATLETLREFENIIKPHQKEILMQRIDNLPEDNFYAVSHGIDPKQKDPLPTEIDEIHVNSIQRSRPDYKNDQEESSGSMEDYYLYKGISAPVRSSDDDKKLKR